MIVHELTRPVEDHPLLPDEPCYLLVEMNLHPPSGHAMHRYQLVQVVRNDALVWIRIDMGLADEWPDIDQLRVLTLGTESVAWAQDFADEKRADMFWRNYVVEHPSTLIEDYVASAEELRKWQLGQSTFGPGYTRQRGRHLWRFD